MARTLDKELVQIALDQIGNKFFSVEFIKVDGSVKRANGRLNVTSRMAHNALSDVARARFAKNGQVPYVDLSVDPATDRSKGWRSFKMDSVISLRFGEAELTAK